MKKIAIIGSSGGNLYNLGGADPEKLLGEIYAQCESAGFEVSAVQFIAADASMDNARPTTAAGVYTLSEGRGTKAKRTYHGKLADVNGAVKDTDAKIAEDIRNGNIDGLIVMSADPGRANIEVFRAAAETKVPIVGTGGTSMAMIAASGAKVVATSGTTGTTSRTRAVSFVASLAKHWGMKYRPDLGGASAAGSGSGSGSGKSLFKRINIRSIMIPALPGFIAMAIVLAASHIPGLEKLNDIFEILLKGLPVLVAVLAAKQVSELDEVSIVSGIVAGVLSVEGGLIGGIIGGLLAGIFVRYLFELCLNWRFPMTTVNIVAGGISGLAAGLIMHYLLSPLALMAGDYIKLGISATLAYSPILAGLLAGLVIWPAILAGVYHAVILPLVLLEMEKSGFSFLGAVDMVGLVMVAAGINLANIIAPRERSEAAVATPGLLINLGFGTFVESAYPFMFANKVVFISAIIFSGLGGMLLGYFNVMGVAYVPAFVSPFMSNNALKMGIVMAIVMVLTCIATVIANRFKAIVKNQPSPQVTQSIK
ncbi:PTS sugar transporter [Izhakiella australiensis]|uniref:PTS sugar transporter n=1 Tax=Izhakiella australiensis TaxID=1926881 RepID=A0A1S8YSJ9_9GAMM|nr:PTS sugar transporter [Izhakiella australiensis]OON42151.1 PTS sugar transporter [Izhakiella australiensis]